MEMGIGLNAESTLLAACCLLVSLTALSYVQFRFSEGRRVPLASKQTGAQIARTILQENGVFGVEVVQAEGFLTDHYDPVERRLGMSIVSCVRRPIPMSASSSPARCMSRFGCCAPLSRATTTDAKDDPDQSLALMSLTAVCV